MKDYGPTVTKLRGDELPVTGDMRAQAFWLVQKYSSLTYIQRMLEIYSNFVKGYDEFARRQYGNVQFYRENLQMMYTYQGLIENGLRQVRAGYKHGYAEILKGLWFGDFLIGRRFENGDLWIKFGYRHEGDSEGLFAWAMIPIKMSYKVELTLKASWAFPRILDPYFEPFGFPPVLDPLPPSSGVRVPIAHEVPLSGVWLPIDVPNLCPNFLWQGEHAPPAHRVSVRLDYPEFPGGGGTEPTPAETDYDYTAQPTTWELHWEDHRYLDGKIPDEESAYLDPSTEPPPWPPRVSTELLS